jgi:hypothetical protein
MKTYGNVTRITGAVVALALSATALANHKEDHVRGTGPGSKISLDVENVCVPLNPSDPDVEFDTPTLMVVSTIKNESETDISVPVVVKEKSVTAMELLQPSEPPKRKSWDPVGLTDMSLVAEPPLDDPQEPLAPDSSRPYVSYIDLCDATSPLDAKAIMLNAEIQIMIEGRNFIGNCDDPNRDDEIDESRIDFDDSKYAWLKGWRGCPASP